MWKNKEVKFIQRLKGEINCCFWMEKEIGELFLNESNCYIKIV